MKQYETKVIDLWNENGHGHPISDAEVEKLIVRMGQEGWQCVGPLRFREFPIENHIRATRLLFQRPTLGHPYRSENGG